MAVVRLEPASLYPRERDSVLVPLPLLDVPERVELLGETWRRKPEFHVTAVSTSALAGRVARARGMSDQAAEDEAWAAIAAVIAVRTVGPVLLRDELRVVCRDEERTIIAMAEVEGLVQLHERLAAALGVAPEPPPAHVTLYTRPGGEGIGLHTAADLEQHSRPLGERPFAWPPSDPSRRSRNMLLSERYVAAVNARDVPDDLFAPGFTMENVATAVTERTYHGVEGVYEWIHDFFDVLDDARLEADPIVVGDDYLVGRLRITGRGSASGAPVDMRYYGVMWVVDGRIARAVGYARRRDALAAVGADPEGPAAARPPGDGPVNR